jgi:hypothetical protein
VLPTLSGLSALQFFHSSSLCTLWNHCPLFTPYPFTSLSHPPCSLSLPPRAFKSRFYYCKTICM